MHLWERSYWVNSCERIKDSCYVLKNLLFRMVVKFTFPGGSDGNSVCLQCLPCERPEFSPWVRKISWRRKWHPTPVLLPGKSHGWWNLIGYSPWGHKESDMTERLRFTSLPASVYLFLSWCTFTSNE